MSRPLADYYRRKRTPAVLAIAAGLCCFAAAPASGNPQPATPAPAAPATPAPAAPANAAPAAPPPAAPAPAPAPAPALAPAPSAAAAPAADFGKGALYGRVLDITTGKPVADATVALQDKSGKVVAWSKTDQDGNYAIGSDTLSVLQLRPSRRRGLLANLVRGVGRIVAAPVNLAVNTVKQVNPVQTVKNAVISAATSNPAPLAAQAVQALSDQAEKKAKENLVKTVLGERQAAPPKEKRDEVVPGEVRIVVSAPGYQEIKGKAGAYWMEAADEPAKNAPKEQQQAALVGPRAWLEPVKLAPAGAADKKSEIENVAVLLAEPRLEPTLAPAGGTVKIAVKLNAPAPPPGRPLSPVRVFAREDKKRVVVELKPGEGENAALFSGDLPLDPKTPAGDTTITLVALRAEPVEVNLRESKDDPLLDFAQRLDDLDPDKPYEFDPRIMASENRLDITLTVLDPKQGTSPAAPAADPPAAPAPAAPAQPAPVPAPAPAQPAKP